MFWLISVIALLVILAVVVFAFDHNKVGKEKREPARCAVKAVIPVGITPSNIALSPDGCVAYVTDSNGYGLTGLNGVTVIDTKCNRPITTVFDPSFASPFALAVDCLRKLVYITNSDSTTISILDMATNTVIGTIPGFDGPSGIVILPGSQLAYVNNYGSAGGVGVGLGTTVNVVDLETRAIVGSAITVGLAPAALAASHCGRFVYSINYVTGLTGAGTLSVIETTTNTVTATITGFSGPFGIALTRGGERAYVTNFGSNNFTPIGTTVSVVDLIGLTIIDTIQVGLQPSGIAICNDYAYVANFNSQYNGSTLAVGQGTVSVIDTRTNRVLARTIPVGPAPGAVACNKRAVYVVCYSGNSVSVIH